MTNTDTIISYTVKLDEKGQTALKSVFEQLVEKAANGDIEPMEPPPEPKTEKTKGEKKDKNDPNVPSSRYTDNVHYWMQKNGAQLPLNEDQFAGVIQALRNHEDVPEIIYGEKDAKMHDSDLFCALRQVYRKPPPPEPEFTKDFTP